MLLLSRRCFTRDAARSRGAKSSKPARRQRASSIIEVCDADARRSPGV